VIDTPGISLHDLKLTAGKLMLKPHGLSLIVIDYIQLMKGSASAGNREQEISSITRELKSPAKALKLPVIALSHKPQV